MIDEMEGIADLPEDLEGPASAFKPRKHKLEKAKAFAAINAIGLVSLTIGLWGMVMV